MQKNHKFFSNLALNLAEKHLGQTNINPTVGCIIEKNNSVIREIECDVFDTNKSESLSTYRNIT